MNAVFDALGNPVVLGNWYRYSRSDSGRAHTTIGKVIKITPTKTVGQNMCHNQFRYIRSFTGTHTDIVKAHMPRLLSLIGMRQYPAAYDEMFVHELAHCMELADRGQIDRLEINNFGWTPGKIIHNTSTATIECRVFALQYLLEDLFGANCKSDILGISYINEFLSNRLVWKSDFERCSWLVECSPKDRIEADMDLYRPKLTKLLNQTVDYIVDRCAKFV